MQLEVIGQLKKFNDLIGNRNRDFAGYSIVPHPTTLPRAPFHTKWSKANTVKLNFACAHGTHIDTSRPTNGTN
jgi:hypothetical protein